MTKLLKKLAAGKTMFFPLGGKTLAVSPLFLARQASLQPSGSSTSIPKMRWNYRGWSVFWWSFPFWLQVPKLNFYCIIWSSGKCLAVCTSTPASPWMKQGWTWRLIEAQGFILSDSTYTIRLNYGESLACNTSTLLFYIYWKVQTMLSDFVCYGYELSHKKYKIILF